MSKEQKGKRNQKESRDDMVGLINNLERDDDLKFNRRSFLKSAVGATVTLGVATLPFSVLALKDKEKDDNRKEIAKLADIPKDSAINFQYPSENEPAILVHTKDGELKAYNNKCTHLQCPVFYEKEESVLLCPCHRGFFSVDNGHPLAGPPQRELPLIDIQVENGVVYAVGRQIRHG
ncbi:ubiquinol-cytochrome c reductase iron-sulfur subunit [Pontibacillus sp. HMF3514]|uniref:QcrA and Rieske domain-containing protein n=1 Tax=Pontibacillus sp. HMF3514 TaxID=2692425 RepID=UPI00131FE6F2|nr:Rieske (2Fe-2S) protein [Pontibacillus sp. HMF3514]QHE53827.1 Rieske 2Fe-2S domain-containing protein [Pontibacillus sp. HMF3514]